MRITTTAFIDPGATIGVSPPRGRVPWVITVDHQLAIHVASRDTLTAVRDAITEALTDNPEAS